MMWNLIWVIFFSWWLTNNEYSRKIISKIPFVRLVFLCIKCSTWFLGLFYILFPENIISLLLIIVGKVSFFSFLSVKIQQLYDEWSRIKLK
jgi:hypothetical protein